MNITFETEQEGDGRWLPEVPELAGVMAYGTTVSDAIAKGTTRTTATYYPPTTHASPRARP